MSEKSEVSQKLSVMMFLEFFIWGAWYVTVGNYIGAQGWENAGAVTGNVYTLMPIAALISPLFVGLVADRFFSTEKVLSVLFFLGGGIMLALPTIADTPGKLTVLLFIYTLSYAPTLALTNSLAFHHVTNPEKQFPLIRVFGTIGWIACCHTHNIVFQKQLGNPKQYFTVFRELNHKIIPKVIRAYKPKPMKSGDSVSKIRFSRINTRLVNIVNDFVMYLCLTTYTHTVS